MSSSSSRTSAEAYAVARRLHELTDAARHAFAAVASVHGLSAPQARLILRLFEATAMRDLADHLACDTSNVTGIAARLIERGFITATPGSDRRVKLLELTPSGRQLRAALQRQVAEASPVITRLSDAERRTLIRLLGKLVDPNAAEPG